jgi:hypothetical protein
MSHIQRKKLTKKSKSSTQEDAQKRNIKDNIFFFYFHLKMAKKINACIHSKCAPLKFVTERNQ